MKPISLQQQLDVVAKVHEANESLSAAYPDTLRIVSVKTDRSGMCVYIHDSNLKVEKALLVDPLEFYSTVEAEIALIHHELDAIIKECNEKRMERFTGVMEAVGA